MCRGLVDLGLVLFEQLFGSVLALPEARGAELLVGNAKPAASSHNHGHGIVRSL